MDILQENLQQKKNFSLLFLNLEEAFHIKQLHIFIMHPLKLISSIFITWIQCLYLHFKEMRNHMLPSKETLKLSLPKVFKPFKNVRCSIDCTEFFCQTPRNYAHQGNVYLSYKHHTTFKALIAVTPKGAACFVSDLYE